MWESLPRSLKNSWVLPSQVACSRRCWPAAQLSSSLPVSFPPLVWAEFICWYHIFWALNSCQKLMVSFDWFLTSVFYRFWTMFIVFILYQDFCSPVLEKPWVFHRVFWFTLRRFSDWPFHNDWFNPRPPNFPVFDLRCGFSFGFGFWTQNNTATRRSTFPQKLPAFRFLTSSLSKISLSGAFHLNRCFNPFELEFFSLQSRTSLLACSRFRQVALSWKKTSCRITLHFASSCWSASDLKSSALSPQIDSSSLLQFSPCCIFSVLLKFIFQNSRTLFLFAFLKVLIALVILIFCRFPHFFFSFLPIFIWFR